MTDRPIIFSAPMIRALLDGRKSMTRRVLKPQPNCRARRSWACRRSAYYYSTADGWKKYTYAPGDRLWVREAWRTAYTLNGISPAAIGERAKDAGYSQPWAPMEYAADGLQVNWTGPEWCGVGNLRSPIHMPRWASRLTLTVTDVRVQRLGELTAADALAEGIECHENPCDPRVIYAKLWDDLNAKRGYPWSSNPWIVALTFRTELNSGQSIP